MECSCLNGPRNEATENGRLWSVGLVARGVMGGGGKKGEGIRGDSWRGKTDKGKCYTTNKIHDIHGNHWEKKAYNNTHDTVLQYIHILHGNTLIHA